MATVIDEASEQALCDFVRARIKELVYQLDISPDFIEDPSSARSPGWGTRRCPICPDWVTFGGYESSTKEAWWEHAEGVHQRTYTLRHLAGLEAIVDVAQDALRDPQRYSMPGLASTALAYRRTLLFLAAGDSQHPDYRPEWA